MAMPPVSLGLGFASTAQGTAGGGNVFNAAPLFGNYLGSGGNSNGSDGASALATTSASGQGGLGPTTATSPTPAGTTASTASAFNLNSYLPWLILGAGVVALAFVVVELFKLFKK